MWLSPALRAGPAGTSMSSSGAACVMAPRGKLPPSSGTSPKSATLATKPRALVACVSHTLRHPAANQRGAAARCLASTQLSAHGTVPRPGPSSEHQLRAHRQGDRLSLGWDALPRYQAARVQRGSLRQAHPAQAGKRPTHQSADRWPCRQPLLCRWVTALARSRAVAIRAGVFSAWSCAEGQSGSGGYQPATRPGAVQDACMSARLQGACLHAATSVPMRSVRPRAAELQASGDGCVGGCAPACAGCPAAGRWPGCPCQRPP